MSESAGHWLGFWGRSMARPYSDDLRERVVEAVEAGASRREAADRFEIAPSSAIKWLQRWRESGSVAAKRERFAARGSRDLLARSHCRAAGLEDGVVAVSDKGTGQGSVISPTLANLFLHYAFDMWMARTYPGIPFERYADELICHCRSEEAAWALWSALEARFTACKLVLHPQKTKLVDCKDANRTRDIRSSRLTSSAMSSGRGRRSGAGVSSASPSCPRLVQRR
jgi:Reverse transcriptase (RNA-dependent DNA polymerase)/Homeodomain-like domain